MVLSNRILSEVACCPMCRHLLKTVSGTQWSCNSCFETFPVVNNIPIFLPQNAPTSKLEEIDYDQVHSIDQNAITSIGKSWDIIIRKIGMEGGDAVEIGSGTGALTFGLLQQFTFRTLVATDISFKFLDGLRVRSNQHQGLSIMVCDANYLNFRDESFDAVLGRSILHHLVDYQLTLQSAFKILRKGGVAVFYEPVLQGKIIIAFFANLLIEADKSSADSIFTDVEKNKITALVRHITKSKWYPQDRESLSKIEDKYIFDFDEMNAIAKSIGYSECIFHNDLADSIDATYWSYFVRHMKILGIDTVKLASFEWIGVAFSKTQGLVFADKLIPPMGFFVFKK